jgi:tetratricopeptide (TPR) repeat protein
MEFRLALKDSEEGIKLDPTFGKFSKENYLIKSFYFIVKCYLRKGHALVGMKDLGQAMSAFSKALEIDPNCQVTKSEVYLNKNLKFFFSLGSY